MHKKTALYFVHYGESEKIEKSFAFNVDIFSETAAKGMDRLTDGAKRGRAERIERK